MTKKPTKSIADTRSSDLDEALSVRTRAFQDLEEAGHDDSPKYVDAWVRADNAVRQREKDRRKDIASFTDDELVQRIRALPERRREAIITAAQGASLAGKPLF